MYPENPEGTQVIVGSMNMGYISDTARNRTHNLFRPKREPLPLDHSDHCLLPFVSYVSFMILFVLSCVIKLNLLHHNCFYIQSFAASMCFILYRVSCMHNCSLKFVVISLVDCWKESRTNFNIVWFKRFSNDIRYFSLGKLWKLFSINIF